MAENTKKEAYNDYRDNVKIIIANIICFWFGINFIAFRTIFPVLISRLTQNDSISLSILSIIVSTGWLLPQIFTANWVRNSARKMDITVKTGFFAERLPVILLIPSILLIEKHPVLTAGILLFLIAWHHLGSGIIAVSWQELLAKIIPLKKRGNFYGIANLGGMTAGFIGASLAAWFLKRCPFPLGYFFCFTGAAVFIFISWIFLTRTHEPEETDNKTHYKDYKVSTKKYWLELVKILKNDKNYRFYIISQILASLGSMSLGFLAAYAVNKWSLPDTTAGLYTMAMLLFQAPGNLLFGLTGDRKGYKAVTGFSLLAIIVTVFIAGFSPIPELFFIVFAFMGSYYAGVTIAGMMIVFEFSKPELRPFYIGLNNTILGIFSAIAPVIGGILITITGHTTMFIISGVMYSLSFIILLFFVKDPRKLITGKGED